VKETRAGLKGCIAWGQKKKLSLPFTLGVIEAKKKGGDALGDGRGGGDGDPGKNLPGKKAYIEGRKTSIHNLPNRGRWVERKTISGFLGKESGSPWWREGEEGVGGRFNMRFVCKVPMGSLALTKLEKGKGFIKRVTKKEQGSLKRQ